MNWQVALILSLTSLSVYNLLQKLASARISSYLALPFITIGIVLASSLTLIAVRVLAVSDSFSSKQGILFSLLAGLFWGIGQIFALLIYYKGAPLSIGLPLLLGGLTIVGSAVGILFFKEPVSFLKFSSIGMVTLGILLLSRA